MARRIAAAHEWLVLEGQGRVVGYAYATTFHPRAAYRWACEVSVYLEPGRRRTGAGRALYEDLLARLTARGFRMAIAGMTLPNDASAGLHRALGFEPVGTYRRIGYKHGAWHDVAWTQRPLATGGDPPAEPTSARARGGARAAAGRARRARPRARSRRQPAARARTRR